MSKVQYPSSAQATGRDGAAPATKEAICRNPGCGHVESAHYHDARTGCMLQTCACNEFMPVDHSPARESEPFLDRPPFPQRAIPTKDTNPKDAVGTCKVPCSTVSAPVIAEVGLAMLEGARKYGRHNFRVSGVRASVYYDAVKTRHLDPWWEGEDIDPDSGLSHITKAIAGLVVLRDSMIQGNWVDDRPPPSPAGWLAELNKKAAAIVAKYPDAKEAFLATDTAEDIERKLGR